MNNVCQVKRQLKKLACLRLQISLIWGKLKIAFVVVSLSAGKAYLFSPTVSAALAGASAESINSKQSIANNQ